MMEMLLVIVLVIMLPFVLFFGVVGLAIFVWCWNRIGRYFINFGRWLGSWRNFIPLSILGILGLMIVAVIFPIVGLPAALTAVLLVLWVLVTLVIFLFALIAWTLEFSQWFWPKWRRLVWSGVVSMWGSLPAQSSKGKGTQPRPAAKASGRKQQPEKRSGSTSFWNLMLGRSPQPAKSSVVAPPGPASVPPLREEEPVRRTRFATFWALMLGKPQPKKQQARPTRVQTTEQTLGPSETMAATAGAESGIRERTAAAPRSARREKRAKRPWFTSFWSLMLGRPPKPPGRKVPPEEIKPRDRGERVARTAAVDANTGTAVRAARTTAGEKPANRGFFGGMWNSIVRGVTFVVGLIILAVLWVVQKVREGIEWIRVRLNLD